MVSLPHSGPVSAPGLTGQPFSFLEMVFLSRGAVGLLLLLRRSFGEMFLQTQAPRARSVSWDFLSGTRCGSSLSHQSLAC